MSVRKGKIYIDNNTVDVTLNIPAEKIYELGNWTAVPNVMDHVDPPNVVEKLPEVIGLRNWHITPTNPVDDEERTFKPRPTVTWTVPKVTLQNVTYTFNTTTNTTNLNYSANTPFIITGP